MLKAAGLGFGKRTRTGQVSRGFSKRPKYNVSGFRKAFASYYPKGYLRKYRRGGGGGSQGQKSSVSTSYTKYNNAPRRKKNIFQARVQKASSALNMLRSDGAFRIEAGGNAQNHVSKQWLIARSNGDGTSLQDMFTQTGLVSTNNRLFVESTLMKFNLTNQSTSVINLRILDCVYRHDMNYGDTDQDPDVLFQRSVADLTVSMTDNTVGVTPFIGGRFGEMVKINRVRNYTLNPGQIRHHTVYAKEDWMVPRYRMYKNVDLQTIAKRTKFTMFIAWGMPVNSALTKTDIGTAPVGVDIHWTYHSKLRFTQDNAKNMIYLTNSHDPLRTLVTPMVVDDDSGLATNAVTV